MTALRYSPGDKVQVREAYPPGHVRTPHFVRGCTGEVQEIAGVFPNPEELAYGRDGLPSVPLYRVVFKQSEVWDGYEGPAADTVVIDLYEHWLEPRT
ncbi:MAG: nitrile hydratase subunit beta [Rhodospirillales bacterium]|jgi:nitrile hydratase|nr:nitrile hydratase subunit beta [Rhodospirillales bacterium]